jgi:hypothetical protein
MMMLINSQAALGGLSTLAGRRETEAWLFRDDIGAPHGIKGYEE